MSKRKSATTATMPAKYKCKPCNLCYDNQTQLVRHRDDRHGPQVMCSFEHTQAFVVPHKRTDVQRRHLVKAHGFSESTEVSRVRQLFLPYFEECDTPALNVPLHSAVVVPSSTSTSSLPTEQAALHVPVIGTGSSPVVSSVPIPPEIPATPTPATIPNTCIPVSLDTLIDETTVPDSLEAFLNETETTSLPPLSLDWTFSNPTLSEPIRYKTPEKKPTNTSPTLRTPTLPLNYENTDYNNNKSSDVNTPTIPLDSTQQNISTYSMFPFPRINEGVSINGLDVTQQPVFPPRRLKVPARKPIDPRLLFRNAPSEFLAGSMARIAAFQRKEIINQANEDNTRISFENQNFAITRVEQIQLLDGRTLTMKTTCTLDDGLKICRGTQTQTE